MREMSALYDAGYSEPEIRKMMGIEDNRVWYQYKRRFARFLAKTAPIEGMEEAADRLEAFPEGYAPVNPIMYDKNLGTDQSQLINELVRTKKIDRLRGYELKRLFRPLGDDRFTRACLERLASRCREMNLSWQTSTDLGWKMRRRISRKFDKNFAEEMVDEMIAEHVKR